MAFSYSSYFGLIRLSNTGPEAKNWAVTDYNPEITSKIMYALSRHTHTGSTPIKYPGYNYANPATPITVTLKERSEATPGGVLAPGTTVGVRFSYVDAFGLETDASPEQTLTLSPIIEAPAAPTVGPIASTPVPNAITGGTYVYGVTKGKGAGETELSPVSVVEVPFNSTIGSSYTVPVTFDPIADYNDGTDKLYIYRSTGLSSTFQLVKTYNSADSLGTPITITDSGSLENASKSPPAASTFDRNKLMSINASALVHPADARDLRVYITQTPGVYGTNHLLETVDLTTPTGPNPATPTKNEFNYLGSETFQAEYPKEFSQLPQAAGKINLGTEAYGAPVLTDHMNFNGFRANNIVLPSALANATPVTGGIYYDSGTSSLKFYTGSTWSTLSVTGGYTHSTDEPGGHSANRIYHSNNAGGTTASTIFSAIATPVPAGSQFRKVVQPVYRSPLATPNVATTSATFSDLVALSQKVTPEFAGQWLEIIFTGDVIVNPGGASSAHTSFQFEIGAEGLSPDAIAESYRTVSAPATPLHVPLHMYFATPISKPVTTLKVSWLTSAGTSTSLGQRRQLFAKLLF